MDIDQPPRETDRAKLFEAVSLLSKFGVGRDYDDIGSQIKSKHPVLEKYVDDWPLKAMVTQHRQIKRQCPSGPGLKSITYEPSGGVCLSIRRGIGFQSMRLDPMPSAQERLPHLTTTVCGTRNDEKAEEIQVRQCPSFHLASATSKRL